MRIKTIILVTVMMFSVAGVNGQEGFSPMSMGEITTFTLKINGASKQMKTFTCNFVQTKAISLLSDEMKSNGVMYYKYPDKLRWEYLRPYTYVFLLNGSKVMVQSGKTTNIVDVNTSKLFSEISKIIIVGVNGIGVNDKNRYDAAFFTGEKSYLVRLKPKQKDLKKMFSEIKLYFDKQDYSVKKVAIEEKGGDKTEIEMLGKRMNVQLDEKIFFIN